MLRLRRYRKLLFGIGGEETGRGAVLSREAIAEVWQQDTDLIKNRINMAKMYAEGIDWELHFSGGYIQKETISGEMHQTTQQKIIPLK